MTTITSPLTASTPGASGLPGPRRAGFDEWAQQVRDAARAADPQGFSLKDFHTRALALGGLPLDVLRSAVLA